MAPERSKSHLQPRMMMPRFQYSNPSGGRIFVDGPEAFVAALRTHRQQPRLPLLELDGVDARNPKNRANAGEVLSDRHTGEEPALHP